MSKGLEKKSEVVFDAKAHQAFLGNVGKSTEEKKAFLLESLERFKNSPKQLSYFFKSSAHFLESLFLFDENSTVLRKIAESLFCKEEDELSDRTERFILALKHVRIFLVVRGKSFDDYVKSLFSAEVLLEKMISQIFNSVSIKSAQQDDLRSLLISFLLFFKERADSSDWRRIWTLFIKNKNVSNHFEIFLRNKDNDLRNESIAPFLDGEIFSLNDQMHFIFCLLSAFPEVENLDSYQTTLLELKSVKQFFSNLVGEEELFNQVLSEWFSEKVSLGQRVEYFTYLDLYAIKSSGSFACFIKHPSVQAFLSELVFACIQSGNSDNDYLLKSVLVSIFEGRFSSKAKEALTSLWLVFFASGVGHMAMMSLKGDVTAPHQAGLFRGKKLPIEVTQARQQRSFTI